MKPHLVSPHDLFLHPDLRTGLQKLFPPCACKNSLPFFQDGPVCKSIEGFYSRGVWDWPWQWWPENWAWDIVHPILQSLLLFARVLLGLANKGGDEEGGRSDVNKSDMMPAFWGLTNNAVTMLFTGDSFLNVYANRSERALTPLSKDHVNAFIKYSRWIYF